MGFPDWDEILWGRRRTKGEERRAERRERQREAKEYEKITAREFLRWKGYAILPEGRFLTRGRKHEIDLIAVEKIGKEKNKLLLVDAKNWKNRVGRGPVAKLEKTLDELQTFRGGIIVSRIGFTSGAREVKEKSKFDIHLETLPRRPAEEVYREIRDFVLGG